MTNPPKHHSRGYLESERLRAERRMEWGAVWFILLLFVIFGFFATRHDNEREEADNKVMQAKYDKWVAYRNKNCKLTEQLFGVKIGSGKFSRSTNANSYECKNGMKYTVEVARDTGKELSHDIPNVKE